MAGFHLSKQKWFALVVVILATADAIWFFYFRSDDATAVRKRLREAVAFAEKQPKGTGLNLQAAGAAHTLGEFFAMETDIEISGYSRGQTYTLTAATRAQVVSSYFMLRPLITSLSVSLAEIDVSFLDDAHDTASVKCSAMATGTTQNGDSFREGRLISAELVREDGEWRFRTLRADPVISFE
jgi:hypothetical protein